MSARFVTSHVTAIAFAPIDAATDFAPAALMSATATFAPSSAYSRAMPSPKPLAAPVTMVTLSFSLISSPLGQRPWYWTTVFTVQNSSSARKPFSRPWPLFFTPPNGSSTPPPAPYELM